MAQRRIALFGGTFDPVHLGHTGIAAKATEHIGAEKVVFIPAKRSPLKGFSPIASDDDRLTMITLTIAGNARFEVSDCELRRAAPSYTLRTVRQFEADYGGAISVHWLIGADSIDDLPHWHRIAELIDTCFISAMYRAGCEPPDFARFEPIWGRERVEKLRKNIIQTPLIDISSTEIRNRLAAGQDASDMLHPAVADYIREHGLYQSQAGSRPAT